MDVIVNVLNVSSFIVNVSKSNNSVTKIVTVMNVGIIVKILQNISKQLYKLWQEMLMVLMLMWKKIKNKITKKRKHSVLDSKFKMSKKDVNVERHIV